jgi:quinol monooxygenase YgiN
MSEVHVFAHGTAAPGKADEVREILHGLVAESIKEPGVVHYMLHENPAQAGDFHFFEVYKDQAAVDAHMASKHFNEAAARFVPMLAGAPSIIPTKFLAGK